MAEFRSEFMGRLNAKPMKPGMVFEFLLALLFTCSLEVCGNKGGSGVSALFRALASSRDVEDLQM
jgi:hypothetical protein